MATSATHKGSKRDKREPATARDEAGKIVERGGVGRSKAESIVESSESGHDDESRKALERKIRNQRRAIAKLEAQVAGLQRAIAIGAKEATGGDEVTMTTAAQAGLQVVCHASACKSSQAPLRNPRQASIAANDGLRDWHGEVNRKRHSIGKAVLQKARQNIKQPDNEGDDGERKLAAALPGRDDDDSEGKLAAALPNKDGDDGDGKLAAALPSNDQYNNIAERTTALEAGLRLALERIAVLENCAYVQLGDDNLGTWWAEGKPLNDADAA